ncbi:MAG: phosphohistidine phosphatase SixA [Planctomycetota bacterium]
MRLLLMQHGETLPRVMDPERPLSELGIIDAEEMAHFLPDLPSRVLHSGKLRARQTADAFGEQPEAIDGIGPNDSVEEFAAVANGWTEDTLVVGHLPFMERLVAHLAGGATVKFEPGAVVCLEREGEGAWSIAWMVRPEQLR